MSLSFWQYITTVIIQQQLSIIKTINSHEGPKFTWGLKLTNVLNGLFDFVCMSTPLFRRLHEIERKKCLRQPLVKVKKKNLY